MNRIIGIKPKSQSARRYYPPLEFLPQTCPTILKARIHETEVGDFWSIPDDICCVRR